jgi:hypothetical protein
LIHYAPTLPNCWGGHIVVDYDHAGVREAVVPALHAMRAGGLESFRLFLYHSHTIDGVWPIDSSSGRLVEPYRTNVIRLLTDIRKAGFKQVTVVFNPWGSNDPIGWFPHGSTFDPALLAENWSFIRDVRPLVKQYGPSSTHIDLLNEGAPNDWDLAHTAYWRSYVIAIYRDYVEAYGNEDVTISAVSKGIENFGNTGDDVERLQNLIDLLRATGKPLPTWFDVHPSWYYGAVDDLRAVDDVLSRNGLSQSLVVGEERYNNPSVAAGIDAFISSSRRPVAEVLEWPQYGLGDVQQRCALLPLRIDAYAKVLRRAAPSKTLRGDVGPSGAVRLLTPYRNPVRALVEGTYTIVVRDRSARHAFRLTGTPYWGSSLRRNTGIRFKGTVSWKVKLRPGFYGYASSARSGRQERFTVLDQG